MALRNRVEPMFLEDFYGYRPNEIALGTIETTRNRCFEMK